VAASGARFVIEEISAKQFAERRAAGEPWQLVDVREEWEIVIVSLGDSLQIPMAEIPARLSEIDAATPVAVICHSGGRSRRVAEFLAQQGFERVANVSGGIESWSLTVDAALPRY
jgi:rhodanese-related sulfurtransferase